MFHGKSVLITFESSDARVVQNRMQHIIFKSDLFYSTLKYTTLFLNSWPTYEVYKYEVQITDHRWCIRIVCAIKINKFNIINTCQTRTSDKLEKFLHSVVLLYSICRNLYRTKSIREQL